MSVAYLGSSTSWSMNSVAAPSSGSSTPSTPSTPSLSSRSSSTSSTYGLTPPLTASSRKALENAFPAKTPVEPLRSRSSIVTLFPPQETLLDWRIASDDLTHITDTLPSLSIHTKGTSGSPLPRDSLGCQPQAMGCNGNNQPRIPTDPNEEAIRIGASIVDELKKLEALDTSHPDYKGFVRCVDADTYAILKDMMLCPKPDSEIQFPRRVWFSYNSNTQELKIRTVNALILHEALARTFSNSISEINDACRLYLPEGYAITNFQNGLCELEIPNNGFVEKAPDGGLAVEHDGDARDPTIPFESGVSESYVDLLKDGCDWTWGSDDVELFILMNLTSPRDPLLYYRVSEWKGFVEGWIAYIPELHGPIRPTDNYVRISNSRVPGNAQASRASAEARGFFVEYEGRVMKRMFRRQCLNIPENASPEDTTLPIPVKYIVGHSVAGVDYHAIPATANFQLDLRKLQDYIKGAIRKMQRRGVRTEGRGLVRVFHRERNNPTRMAAIQAVQAAAAQAGRTARAPRRDRA